MSLSQSATSLEQRNGLISRTGRWARWCGICFAWREEIKADDDRLRCATCGNAGMTGSYLPWRD